jgi:hypothetical protein
MSQNEPEIIPYESASPKGVHPNGISRSDLVTLIFRLLAAYLLFEGFRSVAVVVVTAIDLHGFSWTAMGSTLVALAFYALLGAFLWLMAPKLGRRFLPPDSGTSAAAVGLPAADLLAAGFAFLGVMIVCVWAVPSLMFDAFRLFAGPTDASGELATGMKALVVRDVAEIAIGAWLFYRSKQLASRWERTPSSPEAPDSGPL